MTVSRYFQVFTIANVKNFGLIAFVFLFGMLLLFLRNPDPFFNPIIYAEDGTWTALALREGWLHALMYSRVDYFVVVNTAILFMASKISIFLSGDPLSLLPQAIGVVSFVFFSAVATFVFLTVRQMSSAFLAFLAFIAVILIPLGGTQNEVIGRALQVGFYMPLVSVLLLFWRRKSAGFSSRVLIDFSVIVCVATNPFVLAVCFLYLALDYIKCVSFRSFVIKNITLWFPIVVFMFFLIPRMVVGGGIRKEFLFANLVEGVIARPVLYPFVFPWYQHLSDALAVVGLLLFFSVVVLSYFKSKKEDVRFAILFISVVIFSCSAATIIMRPGLTSILSNYMTTFPDRYFVGNNVLIVVLFFISVSQLLVDRCLRLFGVLLLGCFFFVYLVYGDYIFEWGESKMPIRTGFDFTQQLCMSRPADAVGESLVDIYPFPSWKIVVPSGYINKESCLSGFDSLDSFSGRANGIVSYLHDLVSNGVSASDTYEVVGKDPFVVFSLSNNIRPGEGARLRLDLKCSNGFGVDAIPIQVFWRTVGTDFTAPNSMYLFVRQGASSVKLDGFPAWMQAENVTGIRIDLVSPNECLRVMIKNVEIGASH